MDRGPVEVLFITFPADKDVESVVDALREPVEAGHIAVIDLVMFDRQLDGQLELRDADDELWPSPSLAALRLDPHRLLSDDDVRMLRDSVDSDEQAVAVVIEHLWARDAVEALADSGAEVALYARIPTDTVETAFALEDAVG